MWNTIKPTESGVYQVKGFNLGRPANRQFVATVVVSKYRGALVCNLHESTTQEDRSAFYRIADMDEAFQWRGPFVPQCDPSSLHHSHMCRRCGCYYTPHAGVSEDCPQCGYDGREEI